MQDRTIKSSGPLTEKKPSQDRVVARQIPPVAVARASPV